MDKYRFKTEEEMIRDFGKGWRQVLQWNYDGHMDYLLNKPFNGKYSSKNTMHISRVNSFGNWSFNHRSLTKIAPSYNPKKILRTL